MFQTAHLRSSRCSSRAGVIGMPLVTNYKKFQRKSSLHTAKPNKYLIILFLCSWLMYKWGDEAY